MKTTLSELFGHILTQASEYFDIRLETAKNIIVDMKKLVALWRSVAKSCELPKSEIEKMESAFKIHDKFQIFSK